MFTRARLFGTAALLAVTVFAAPMARAQTSQQVTVDGARKVLADLRHDKAFGNAARMIAAGLCDAAIVGGADSLCLTTLYGFHSLSLNAAGPCRPTSGSSVCAGRSSWRCSRP